MTARHRVFRLPRPISESDFGSVTSEAFPIVGFVAAGDGIAALYLGRRRGNELAYVGKAGTGFTQKSARELRQLLEPLVIDRPALTHPVRKTEAT